MKNALGESALQLASVRGHSDTVELLHYGAEQNSLDLSMAAISYSPDAFKRFTAACYRNNYYSIMFPDSTMGKLSEVEKTNGCSYRI